jgi:hypothetical protein
MMVGSMTADSERAGLYYGTIGMVAVVVEMGSPFIHPVKMRTSWAVGHYNDCCFLVVVLVVPITCHCGHCGCDSHYHGGCNHFIHHHLHTQISYSLNFRHLFLRQAKRLTSIT